ncbi:MAG: peptidoglycan DD-metalloendopeptidase family protein [Candidatus Lokiarchaeota archaeon]|nr:peptidoglycan DD-metalloendopeptidase family protein [Candidatus Lokiarchaeota archaeon]
MNAKKKAILILPLIVIVSIIGYSYYTMSTSDAEPPTLEFPIAEPENIEKLSAYHTPDWGEPGIYHNGIDLITSDNVTIISPTAGTVIAKTEHINTYGGNMLFTISIEYNWAWQIDLVLEPDFYDDTNNSLQTSMIEVEVGQSVETGDEIGTLLYNGPSYHSHLHYMLRVQGTDVCAYNYSSSAAQTIFDNIAEDSDTRVLYPYEEPNFATNPNILRNPMIIIPAIVGAIYGIILVIILKKR